MKLFRSVGEKEFRLIQQNGFKSFPARMPGRRGMNLASDKEYAMQIAAKRSNEDRRNYIVEFEADDNYLSWFSTKTTDGHQEFNIPAEQIDEFNSHITGLISVVGVFE
jgi:hypothetical protein